VCMVRPDEVLEGMEDGDYYVEMVTTDPSKVMPSIGDQSNALKELKKSNIIPSPMPDYSSIPFSV
jgi:hypothetical protein